MQVFIVLCIHTSITNRVSIKMLHARKKFTKCLSSIHIKKNQRLSSVLLCLPLVVGMCYYNFYKTLSLVYL